MLKIYFAIAVLLLLGIMEFRKWRHLLAATVVYPVMWILSMVGIVIKGDEYYEVSLGTLCLIVVGYILFIAGFRVVQIRGRQEAGKSREEMCGNYSDDVSKQIAGLDFMIFLLLCLAAVSAAILIRQVDFRDISNSIVSMRVKAGKGEFSFPYLIVVGRYLFRCMIWYIALIYSRIPKNIDIRLPSGRSLRSVIQLRFVLVIAISFIVFFTDISRNDILMTFLPVVFIFLISHKRSNNDIVCVLMIAFVLFGLVFTMYNTHMEQYFVDSGTRTASEESKDFAHSSFMGYLSGSIPALDQLWRKEQIQLISISGGSARHTFSIFYAVIDRLFGTSMTPQVKQEAISIGAGRVQTNVYTVYQWLGMDFGLAYAAVFQFVYGLLYGILYNKALNGSMKAVYCYAVASYPLVMMFFEDQFLSIAQSWLILILFSYFIFFVCNTANIKARGECVQRQDHLCCDDHI